MGECKEREQQQQQHTNSKQTNEVTLWNNLH